MTTDEARYVIENRGWYSDAMYLRAVEVIESARRQGFAA